MRKDIDVKNRIVNMYDVDTGIDEKEIIKYLDKQMKVRFHSVWFSPKCNYEFTGKTIDRVGNSFTINGYSPRKGSYQVIITS